jgi:hypothetical protein
VSDPTLEDLAREFRMSPRSITPSLARSLRSMSAAKRKYGQRRSAGRSFDAAVLADVAARAAELQPLPAPPARRPDWGRPLTWRDTDRDNCLRDAVHHAFGISYARIPPRPSNPPDGWGDQFDAGLRAAGLHLELVSGRDLDVGKGERWVALITDHAVAMIGQRVLRDSAERWAPGEQLDVPVVAGYVRRRVKTDKWGRPLR